MIDVIALETPELGDRSYLVTDGEVALVIDPQRDIDRVSAIAAQRDVRITHVLETHIHNDYVTGGLALARSVGAEYMVSADDDVDFARSPVRGGDEIQAGGVLVKVIHTPGHTFNHLSFVVEDSAGRVAGVFTGGSLLFASTGRPDLLGREHAEQLARLQHASARRLADSLPPYTEIFPTHGFGSHC